MVKFAPLAAAAALAILAQAIYVEPESYDHDKAFLDAAHSLSSSHGHKIRAIMQEREDAKSKLSVSPTNVKLNPGSIKSCGCNIAASPYCCGHSAVSPLLLPLGTQSGVQARDLTRRAHDEAFMVAARELVATSSGSNKERALVQVRDVNTGLYSTTVCHGPIENCKLSVGIV